MCASDVVAGSALLLIKLLEVKLLVLFAAAACFSPPAGKHNTQTHFVLHRVSVKGLRAAAGSIERPCPHSAHSGGNITYSRGDRHASSHAVG
jgi:hypothetical protein